MKNKTLNKSIITVFAILMGMLFVLSDLAAQEEVRRGLRGGNMSERDPSDSGGAEELSEERAKEGRPIDPFSDNPGSEEPEDGPGPSEGPGGDDPFMEEEPEGGPGPSEGPGT